MDFKQELQIKIDETESILQEYAPAEEGLYKTVCQAMNYSLMAGGKRLRPIFLKEVYKLFGGTDEAFVRPFMAAVEMIHTYSLIHDDLPALDNDDYRRGKKTCHVVYGEPMAILAGDGLLNYAFETACKAMDAAGDYDKLKRVSAALRILAVKPGLDGMLGGQVVDVEKEGSPLSKDILDFIHEKKTSALMECSMMIGAVLAGASLEDVEIVEQIAKKVGIAFQIQDDILDVTSSLEILGKPVHSDEKNEKTTYVSLMGVSDAGKEVKRLSGEALELLEDVSKKSGRDNTFLKELLHSLIHREK